jgi:hypothetical protein
MGSNQVNLTLLLTFFFGVVALASAGTLRAGVAKVNGTLPLGVPLAGYNHGDRFRSLKRLNSFISFHSLVTLKSLYYARVLRIPH